MKTISCILIFITMIITGCANSTNDNNTNSESIYGTNTSETIADTFD